VSAAELAALARRTWQDTGPAPARLEWLESVDSTSSELLRAGLPPIGGAAVLAEHQSAGRGRLGRQWRSAVGASLCLSVAMRLPRGLAAAAGLSLAAGVAVAECLRAQGAKAVGLKWPNDLYARDAKLGGLLVELGADRGQSFAVLGLGLNLCLPAGFDAGQPATDLAACGLDCSALNRRAALAASLVSALLAAFEVFNAQGLEPFRARYASLDLWVGREVRVSAGGKQYQGVLAGIDESGALRLGFPGGERVFASAEVSLRVA
jgi:BirA family biotin operon repressor/biotin-[acetyl-CoA-carboxylase] ligase